MDNICRITTHKEDFNIRPDLLYLFINPLAMLFWHYYIKYNRDREGPHGLPPLTPGSCSPDQGRGRLRPALLDWASSRPPLTMDALALLLTFGSDNTWYEDFLL